MASPLPPELIDCILDYIRVPKSHSYYSHPKSKFYPFLFINKLWHDVTERRLYHSVCVNDPKSASSLCSTLTDSRRIASYVRALCLGTRFLDFDESTDHIAILRLCPNADTIQIFGYNEDTIPEFWAALASKSPTVLAIGRHGTGKITGLRLCTTTKMLRMMGLWTRLRKLDIQCAALGGGYEDTVGLDLLPEGCLPELRTVNFGGGVPFRDAHLTALAKMAPSLQELAMPLDKQNSVSDAALFSSLRRWARTLRSLSLTRYCSVRSVAVRSSQWEESLQDVLPLMVNLEYLLVYADLFSLSSLARCGPKLRSLGYYEIRTRAELDDFTRHLRDTSFLPNLRKLWVNSTSRRVDLASGRGELKLWHTCYSRGIIMDHTWV